jgi:hypothetical protein
MASLPQELIDRICGYLTRKDLKNTLTISRSFQYASERASGAYATFILTEENTEEFLNRYSGRRWAYLRCVRFRTHLPPYEGDDMEDAEDGETHRCRESKEELEEKDKLFTEQVKFVFRTLDQAEQQVGPGNLQLTIFTPIRDIQETCPHRKCTSWRLHLQDPDTLPKLESVRAFSMEDEKMIFPLEEDKSLSKVDLRVLIDCAAKFPRLEYLGSKLGAGSPWTTDYSTERSEAVRHYTRDWPGTLRDSRHDFATALENTTLPSTLRQAQFDFLYPLSEAERIDQTVQLPNLVNPAPYDPFSNSLRLISHQLRKLELKVFADATLFWPTDGAASWPNLESLCVLLHMATPSGQWYFEGPKGDGHDDKGFEVTDESYPPLADTPEDEEWDEDIDDNGLDISARSCTKFRVQPNDDVLVPFLTAFAKAAANMPVLKEACLWTPLKWDWDGADGYENFNSQEIAKSPDQPLGWGITYVAPHNLGFHAFPGQHHSESRQLWWTTAQWRPSDELRHLFQQIGDKNVELLEYWGHDQYEQKLALRPIFEYFQIFAYRHPNSPWPFKSPGN